MYTGIGQLPSPEEVALFHAAESYIADMEPKIRELGIRDLPQWDFDQGTGEIVFSTKDGEPKIKASFQAIGSFSLGDNTWVWSWANDTVEPKVKERIQEVRTYGEEHNIRALTDATFISNQEESWQLASVAAYLSKAELAMQLPTVPGENVGFLYILLSNIEKI